MSRELATPVAVESFPGLSLDRITGSHQHPLFIKESLVVPTNTWVDISPTENPLRVQKAADFVTLDGVIKKPVGVVSLQFGQLDTEYYPDGNYEFPVYCEVTSTYNEVVYVTSTGGLWFSATAGNSTNNAITFLCIHGLNWRAA